MGELNVIYIQETAILLKFTYMYLYLTKSCIYVCICTHNPTCALILQVNKIIIKFAGKKIIFKTMECIMKQTKAMSLISKV